MRHAISPLFHAADADAAIFCRFSAIIDCRRYAS
jgi:hypothetical protein